METALGSMAAGMERLRRNWYWLVILGIVQLILGGIGVTAAIYTTVFSVIFLGWLLLVGGVSAACHAFVQKQWSSFFLDLMTAILYLLVGVMLIENPLRGAEALTLLMAFFMILGGMFRIVAALAGQPRQWGWVFMSGLITLVLGVIIWRQWPISGLWVIGTFVGVEMIFYGWSLIMLGLAVKSR